MDFNEIHIKFVQKNFLEKEPGLPKKLLTDDFHLQKKRTYQQMQAITDSDEDRPPSNSANNSSKKEFFLQEGLRVLKNLAKADSQDQKSMFLEGAKKYLCEYGVL